MAQVPAFYSVAYHSAGCMPDGESYLVECRTRGDLVAAVNDALASYGMTGRARRQVDLVRVWRFIQGRRCSSRASFALADTNPGSLYRLSFDGLSAAEYAALSAENVDA